MNVKIIQPFVSMAPYVGGGHKQLFGAPREPRVAQGPEAVSNYIQQTMKRNAK